MRWLSLILALLFFVIWYAHDRSIEYRGIGKRLIDFAVKHPTAAPRVGRAIDEWGPRAASVLALAAGIDFLFRLFQ